MNFWIKNYFFILILLLWLDLCIAQDITTTVTAVSGSKTLLPCNITPPTEDDAVSLILWYKDESTTPIYSLDARKGNIDQARHASADILSNRAYLQIQHNTAILHLQRLNEDDIGEYRCRVDFRKARTRNFVVYLKIIVPPSKPIIRDANGEQVGSLLGPLNEGDSLTLHCTANSGMPKGQLAWFRESHQLLSTSESANFNLALQSNRNLSNNEQTLSASLRIEKLTREHLMAVYSCRSSNNNLTEPAVTEVTVDLNLRPLTVSIDNDRRPLSADTTVQLYCHSNGSRPAATLHWYKGVERLRSSKTRHSPDGNTSYSTLSFTPSLSDMGTLLSCSAENPLISSASIQDSWKLEINYVPQVTLKLGSKLRHSNIQEGKDVYFECSVKANPPESEIRWWFEGKELRTNTTERIIISGNSLVLQKVTKNLRGQYTCSATNSQGEGQSNSVSLRVQHAPICSPNQRQTKYSLGKLETAKIQCDVLADPPNDLVFTWYLNGTQIMSTNEETSTINNFPNNPIEFSGIENVNNDNLTKNYISTSFATYKPLTDNDYGQLLCVARNAIGKQEIPCSFSLVPAGSPDSLKACSVQNVTDHSIIVGCLPGNNGGLKQKFFLNLQEVTSEQLSTTHQHLLKQNQQFLDQTKISSILTTEELEDYNNEISNLNFEKMNTYKNSKIGKNSKTKISINTQGEKSDEQYENIENNSKEYQEDNKLNELNSINYVNSDQIIDLEPGGSLNLTSDKAKFHVKGLHSGTTYICTLHAVNSRGVSKAVVLVAQTLTAPESMNRVGDGNMWQITLNPLLILLISIVTIIVLIAFIVLFVIRSRFKDSQNSKTVLNEVNSDKSCSTSLRHPKEDLCDMCTFDDKCPDIIPDDKLYTSSILQPHSSSSGSVKNNVINCNLYSSDYSNGVSNYVQYANTDIDNFCNEDNQQLLTTLPQSANEEYEKCHFLNKNLDKIYYQVQSLNKNNLSSMQLLNSSKNNCDINYLDKSTTFLNDQFEALNNSSKEQIYKLIEGNEKYQKSEIENNYVNLKETNSKNFISVKNSVFNDKINNSKENFEKILEKQDNESSNINSLFSINEKLIEAKKNSFSNQDQSFSKMNLQNKSNLSSCSGSCNQLIHGYQIPKDQMLLNNNIHSNRNSFAAFETYSTSYLSSLNRFNFLRNSLRSNYELICNTKPNSIYGQINTSSFRNSIAWPPVCYSKTPILNNLPINNDSYGVIQNSLTLKEKSSNCKNCGNLKSSFDQTLDNFNQLKLNSESYKCKDLDKVSLYDNVDDNNCLQPLLDKSANLLEQNYPTTTSNEHVRILDDCRIKEEIQHSLSLNKLCL